MEQKPRLGFWDIWNMSFGFLGIQFGFGLQAANTSRIFQTFGGEVEDLAIYTIAAPLTGLIVQPIIGYLSDRTWSPRWGRRKPYFLIGAVLASISLILMPNSPSLYMAIGMLWIMDTAFNVSMEPFRAFVGDLLPSNQRTFGYAMQSFFIGIGAVVASFMPTIFGWFGLENTAEAGEIGPSVKWSYYVGAAVFLLAVCWTVFSTKEYSPEQMEKYEKAEEEASGKKDLSTVIKAMGPLALVQFFSWFALFAMWIYSTPAVAQHAFGSGDPATEAYQNGADHVGRMFGTYNFISFAVAFLIPVLAKATSRKMTHQIALICGALGLGSVFIFDDPNLLYISMVGVGIAWASILSMPYAMLVGSIPEKQLGFFVGLFNFSIVIPQILAALMLGWLLKTFFNNDPVYAMMIGGVSFAVAAILVVLVRDHDDPNAQGDQEQLSPESEPGF